MDFSAPFSVLLSVLLPSPEVRGPSKRFQKALGSASSFQNIIMVLFKYFQLSHITELSYHWYIFTLSEIYMVVKTLLFFFFFNKVDDVLVLQQVNFLFFCIFNITA